MTSTHERCDACGFDGSAYADDALLEEIRAHGPRWKRSLRDAGTNLRIRPHPEVWSPLEYAAHTRDITSRMSPRGCAPRSQPPTWERGSARLPVVSSSRKAGRLFGFLAEVLPA